MNFAFSNLLMFARGEGEGAAPVAPDGAPTGGDWMQLLPMLVMFVVLFFFIVIRPQQKEQRQRQETLEALKKNDKVLTIGGIIGTIVDFSNDGQRVTLRVDDGTRIKFTRSSIQGPYDDKPAETESAKT